MSNPIVTPIKAETQKISGKDPLQEKEVQPDRVHYATGVMLDAVDFIAEQTYHRGQLARALAHLHGSGTAAGLPVKWAAADSAKKTPEEIRVEPGLAIDRLGRLIVVPREACIRLDEWFKKQTDDNLKESFYSGAGAVEITRVDAAGKLVRDGDGNIVKDKADGVAADLFIRLKVCENGKTPAFASGPFDALDAVEPSRLRDGYELKLFPRRKPLASPTQIWTDDKDLLHETIFSSWTRMTERIDLPGSKNDGALKGLAEHMDGQDTSFVFLARILMPAAQAANARPERVAGDVLVDNHIRPFVYTAGALFQLMKP